MKKRVFRYFFNALSSQEKWLNTMSGKGFRLIETTPLDYAFEACKPNEYIYKVQFVADKTPAELTDYQAFLKDLGLTTHIKPLALGRYASHAATLRPYARGRAMFATAPGMINKEILIIEKSNDGKPFEIHTDTRDELRYNSLLLNYSLWGILFGLFFILLIGAQFMFDFELMRFKIPVETGALIGLAAFALLLVWYLVRFITLFLKVQSLKERLKSYE